MMTYLKTLNKKFNFIYLLLIFILAGIISKVFFSDYEYITKVLLTIPIIFGLHLLFQFIYFKISQKKM